MPPAFRAWDLATGYAASVARLGAGYIVGKLGPRPQKLLELWEYEGCPYSRRVRDALSQLDLDARIYPCPRGGERYRPEVMARGHRVLPVLRDPGRDIELDESADIVAYLYEHYGAGPVPRILRGALSMASSGIASGVRPMAGRRARASRSPAQPLELYGFEASPYCRIAREALCELEIPYISRTVAKNSPSRAAFVERSGRMMVPYLVDPNTGTEMFESADIAAYLHRAYGA